MQQKGVDRYGTVLFEQGLRRQEISSVDEQSITSALLRLSDDKPRKVYFSIGYGERDVESPSRDGYSVIKWHLENKGYTVGTLNWSATSAWTDEMDVLVIASPRHVLPERDQDTVDDFLLEGGKVLILLNPANRRIRGILRDTSDLQCLTVDTAHLEDTPCPDRVSR